MTDATSKADDAQIITRTPARLRVLELVAAGRVRAIGERRHGPVPFGEYEAHDGWGRSTPAFEVNGLEVGDTVADILTDLWTYRVIGPQSSPLRSPVVVTEPHGRYTLAAWREGRRAYEDLR